MQPAPFRAIVFPSFRGVLRRNTEADYAAAKWEDNFAEPGQTFDAATPLERCFPSFFSCFIAKYSPPSLFLRLYFHAILSGRCFASKRGSGATRFGFASEPVPNRILQGGEIKGLFSILNCHGYRSSRSIVSGKRDSSLQFRETREYPSSNFQVEMGPCCSLKCPGNTLFPSLYVPRFSALSFSPTFIVILFDTGNSSGRLFH